MYANTYNLEELIMVIMGTLGEQHHVLQFSSEGDRSDIIARHPKKTS